MGFEEKVYGGEYETKLPYKDNPEGPYREDHNRLTNQFLVDAEAYAVIMGVPKQYAAKVVSRAWSEGHSTGLTDVYNCLCGLIEIFS